MTARTVVAGIVVVGLLATALFVPAFTDTAQAQGGTEEVIRVFWVDGVAFENVQGGDRTGDIGRIGVGGEGTFGAELTSHANATPDGTNKLVNSNDYDDVTVLSLTPSIATVTESGTTAWDVEGHSPGRVTILMLITDGGDEYLGTATLEVVPDTLDEDTREDTEHAQNFSEIGMGPAVVVMTMVLTVLGTAIAMRGLLSLVIGMFFVIFGSLWFIGLVEITVVIPAFIMAMIAIVAERVVM